MSITISNLDHTYKQGTPFAKKVLFDINLKIGDGEFVGLIGPTQAGKTTLAQYFNALFIPKQGQVIVNGCDTSDKKADLVNLRHSVGYVFQNPDYQLFAPTVGEDIAFGPRNQGIAPTDVSAIVKIVMGQVGLDYNIYFDRDVYALSGGEKRRAAIAGVLACQPKILILDDITAGLDPRGREEIIDLVHSLHQREKITIIFISADMDIVARLVERVIVLNQGRLIADDLPENIFTKSKELQKIGLELPELLTLANSLKECGYDLPKYSLDEDIFLEALIHNLDQQGGSPHWS